MSPKSEKSRRKPVRDAKSRRAVPSNGARRKALSEDAGPSQITESIRAVEAANLLTSPLSRSIDDLLRVAAQAVGASEASVLIRDGNRGGLRFMAAIGAVADKLLKVKIPPGKGIAGFVFSSGQPMAVANAAEEQSFYAEVDRATGFTTQTLLATPLRLRGDVIGVLEFLNRPGEPPYSPFTPEEMDRAALFADALASLVDAHQSANLIEQMFERSIRLDKGDSSTRLRHWIKQLRAAPEHKDLLSMALALAEISDAGDAERQLCRDVVDALGRWVNSRSGSGAEYSY
jgi:signal transduction protein with GAF and PtsI domain